MPFQFYSNEGARPNERAYITTDKQGRIYINRLAQEKMNARTPVKLYIAYDKFTKRIGLTPNPIEGMKPFNFNGNRAYASAKSFLRDFKILPEPHEDAHRYFYDGMEEGLYIFKHESQDEHAASSDDVPEGQTSFDDYEHEEEAAASEAVEIVENESPADLPALTPKEEELFAVINEKPSLTHKQYGEIVGASKNTITKRISAIKKKGYDLPLESR